MRRTRVTKALTVAFGLMLLVGCGDGHDHAHGEGAGGHDGGGSAAVPRTYREAVAKCEELSTEIGRLIARNELSAIHAPGANVRRIARELPELASEGVDLEQLRGINLRSKELAGLFEPLDAAAHDGDLKEVTSLQERMAELIEELKTGTPPSSDREPPDRDGREHGDAHGDHEH